MQNKIDYFIRMFILFPLLLFVMFRMWVLAPRFFGYIAFIGALGLVIYRFSQFFHKQIAKKCALCGGAMSNTGVKKVLKGFINEDKKTMNSIGIKVFKCLDCEKEYHELVYYSSVSGDAVDHRSIAKVFGYMYKMRMNLSGDLPNLKYVKLVADPVDSQFYIQRKKELAKQVIEHNERNGYTDNPIKIDVESKI